MLGVWGAREENIAPEVALCWGLDDAVDEEDEVIGRLCFPLNTSDASPGINP